MLRLDLATLRPTAVVAAAGLVVATAVGVDDVGDGPVLCPLRRATGQPCPLCGTTRSVVAVLDGRLDEALAFNPLGPVLVVVAVVALVVVATGARLRLSP